MLSNIIFTMCKYVDRNKLTSMTLLYIAGDLSPKGGVVCLQGVLPSGGGLTKPLPHPVLTSSGTAVAGTHPTGMHTCNTLVFGVCPLVMVGIKSLTVTVYPSAS